MEQEFNLEGIKGLITSDKVLTLEEEARERFWRPTIAPRGLPTAPQVTAPQVTAPQVTAPQVTAPQVTAPQVTAPQVTAPQVTAPQVTTPQKAPREYAPQAAVKAKSGGAPARTGFRLLSSTNNALIFNNIVMSLQHDRQGGVYIIANRPEKAAAIIETFFGRPDAARIVPLAKIESERFFAQLLPVIDEGKLKNGILVIDAGACSEAKLQRFVERVSTSLPRLVKGLVHLLVWVTEPQLVEVQDLLAGVAAADRVKFYHFAPSPPSYS